MTKPPAIHEEYPFTSRFLEHPGGLRQHYLDEGEGEPVVMVHGNPTWSFYFRRLVLALRPSHRAIVPDHIGCGFSDKPDDTKYAYTLQQRARDLEFLIEQVCPDGRLTLVVHDWGGMIGLACAVRHPERIGRLVILNTAAFSPPPTWRLPWQLRLVRNTPLGPLLVRGLNAFCRYAVRHCCTRRPMPADLRRAYLLPYDSWRSRIAVLRFVQDIPLRPGDPSLAVVREVDAKLETLREVPMLICWGERDFVFDRTFLDEWRRRFPDALVHTFANAGHYVLEDAAAEVVPLVEQFLRRNGGTSS